MGEEKKNPEGEKKPAEDEKKKVPEPDTKPKDDTPPPPPPEDNPKPAGDDKKPDDAKPEEPPPPPPPPEIVLRVYMHCEGCARKVRRCLKGFDGVEEVTTDCKTHKVVVKGEKADPLKVLGRVQKKTHRQVELLSPIPTPPAPEEKKPAEEEKEAPKTEEKKEEPKVVTVVLKVHMHCEACSLEIKKRIERMKEVEEATPDLKNSEVTVKGTFDPAKLVEYVYKRTGKHALIVKQDPPPPPPPEEKKEGDDKGKDGKEENKADDGKTKGDEEKGRGGGGDEAKGGDKPPEEEMNRVEFMRNEYFYHPPPRHGMEMYAYNPYPPQIFSDENPNACFIM